jgi:hypothetical protein
MHVETVFSEQLLLLQHAPNSSAQFTESQGTSGPWKIPSVQVVISCMVHVSTPVQQAPGCLHTASEHSAPLPM